MLHHRWEKALRIQCSAKSHSTVDVFWKQLESRVAARADPLPACNDTLGHGQCHRRRKVSWLPCFPFGGHFLQAVSGYGLASKCLCFLPPCFSLMDYGESSVFQKQRAPNGSSLSLSLLLAALTAGPSLTVPREEMQMDSEGVKY